ncbi:MAG TPA: hypothetical protein VNK96_06540 [Fimbriimonadales bacterium]|nr:hypothetical protein [Fimbriimonadales bacterium]
MKKLLVALMLLVSLGLSNAQDGWKRPDVITGTVVETYTGKSPRTVRIVKEGENLAVYTTAPVNGELEGVPRVEVYSSKGIFTWLEGKPNYALQILLPSSFEVFEYLETPRFSRADLEFNLKGIEKALQKRVLVRKPEKIAGRECMVFDILERPDSMNKDFQRIWIDRETGIALKLQDYFNGSLVYQREFTKFDYGTLPEGVLFAPPDKGVIIKGVVSAQALLRVPETRSIKDFYSDISKVNEASKPPVEKWASSFDTSLTHGYVQTLYREIAANTAQLAAQAQRQQQMDQLRQRRENQLSRREVARALRSMGERGGRAEVSVTVLPDGSRQVQVIGTSEGGERREITLQMDDRGRVIAPGTAAQQQEAQNKKVLVAKSDFVDPKTGEVLTFIQVHGSAAEPYLGPLSLGTGKPISEQKISQAKSYTITEPFKLTVITWQRGEIRYALASSNLSEAQLIEIAAKVKPSQ